MESIKELLWERTEPAVLSHVCDLTRPGSLWFMGAEGYEGLFQGPMQKRSPGRVRRMGLLDRFLFGSSLSKIHVDTTRGFDVSAVVYPMGLDLAAWGLVVDRVGRVFEVNNWRHGGVELAYQGGCCKSRRDWRLLVGTRPPDPELKIRLFYNRAVRLAADRITLAGTVGFGLWDALWMSFDLDRAVNILEHEPDLAEAVFKYWREFHLSSVRAMLDAGIKIVFFREHRDGFPQGKGVAALVDRFVGEHLRDLSKTIRSRGGSLFLDCDADEMLHGEYPVQWGFDGIGPLLFRDAREFLEAAAGLHEELIVVGAVAGSDGNGRFPGWLGKPPRIILAQSPWQVRNARLGPIEDYRQEDVVLRSCDMCASS